MGPLYAEIEIDAPREVIYEYLLDIATRPGIYDGSISDFRLLRLDTRGIGAGARFRFRRRSAWVDTTITTVDPPRRISERGSTGRLNGNSTGTEWEIAETANGLSLVRLSYWVEPHGVYRHFHRFTGGSRWYGRQLRHAVRRLRDVVEAERLKTDRIRVAGGNRFETGVL
ncbi:MAG: SRPBCC family protein [Solirubrobacterales bacterium]